MTPEERQKCSNIYKNFKKSSGYGDFRAYKREEYVDLPLYPLRVENIMDYTDIDTRLRDPDSYSSPQDFVKDVRRMAANCLRYCIAPFPDHIALRKKSRDLLKWVDDRIGQELGQGAVPRLSDDTIRCLDILDHLLEGASVTELGFWAQIDRVLELDSVQVWNEYRREIEFPYDFGRLTSELIEDGLSVEVFLGRAEVILINAERFWGARGKLPDLVEGAGRMRQKLAARAQRDFPMRWPARKIVSDVRPPAPAVTRTITIPSPAPSAAAAAAPSGPIKLNRNLSLQRGDSLPSSSSNDLAPAAPASLPRAPSLGGGFKFKMPTSGAAPAVAATASAQGSMVVPPKEGGPAVRQPSPIPGQAGKVGGGLKINLKKFSSSLGGGGADGGSSTAAVGMRSVVADDSSSSLLTGDEFKPPPPGLGRGGSVDTALGVVGGMGGGPPTFAAHKTEPPKGVFGKGAIKLGNLSNNSSSSNHKRSHGEVMTGGGGGGGGIKEEAVTGPVPKRSKPLSGLGANMKKEQVGGPRPLIALENKESSSAPEGGGATSILQQQQPPPEKRFHIKMGSKPPAPAAPMIRPAEDDDDDDNVPLNLQAPPPKPAAPAKPAGSSKSKNKAKTERRPKKEKTSGGRAPKIQSQPSISLAPSIEMAPDITTAAPPPQQNRPSGGTITFKPEVVAQPSVFEEWEAAAKVIIDKIWRHKWVIPPRKIDLSKFAPTHRYHSMEAAASRYCFDKPVLEKYPELTDAYLAAVERPMDVATVRANLDKQLYANADEFLADLDSVFSNCIAFNLGQDNSFSQELVYAAKHLRTYLDALAAEYLKARDAETYVDTHFNRSGQRQAELRREREARLRSRELKQVEPYRFLYSQMAAFVKSLKAERIIADTLLEPVPDHITAYYAAIERPMWLRAVLQSLDEMPPPKVGDVIDNLHLIQQNAIAYNTPYAERDKVSAKCISAAQLLRKHMEEKLPKVLLDMWEHEQRMPVQERIEKLAIITDGGKARGGSHKATKFGGGLGSDDDSAGFGHALPPKGSFTAHKGLRNRPSGKHPSQQGGDKPGAKPRKDERNAVQSREEKKAKKDQDRHLKEEMMEEIWGEILKRKEQVQQSSGAAAAASSPVKTTTNGVVVLLQTPVKQEVVSEEVVAPMDVVPPEVKTPIQPPPPPDSKEVVSSSSGHEEVVLGEFRVPAQLGKKRREEAGGINRKGGRAVLEELLGTSSNVVSVYRHEDAMMKELQAQMARVTSPSVRDDDDDDDDDTVVIHRRKKHRGENGELPSSSTSVEVEDASAAMEEEEDGTTDKTAGARHPGSKTRREVQVLVHRVEPPVWSKDEWEGGMVSLAFPPCPLVDVTVMTRELPSQDDEEEGEEGGDRIFLNGELVSSSGQRGRGKRSAAGGTGSAVSMEVGRVPVSFSFNERRGGDEDSTLEMLQDEVKTLTQSGGGGSPWGEMGSLRYRDRMVKSYSWLAGLDLDFSVEGRFYVSPHVQREERGPEGQVWHVVHLVAEASALRNVTINQYPVYL